MDPLTGDSNGPNGVKRAHFSEGGSGIADEDETVLPMKKKLKTNSETGCSVEADISINTSTTDIISQKPVEKPIQWPLSLEWKKGSMPFIHKLICALPVVINGRVYCNSSSSDVVLQYDPVNGKWRVLTQRYSNKILHLTSLNGQLVTTELLSKFYTNSTWNNYSYMTWKKNYNIYMWDYSFTNSTIIGSLVETDVCDPHVVAFEKYIIMLGSSQSVRVHVYDTSSDTWFKQIKPVALKEGKINSSVLIDDRWYVSLSSHQNPRYGDEKEHLYWVHIPTLISSATTQRSSDYITDIIWDELRTPPVECPALVSFHGNLLLIGSKECTKDIYRYDREEDEWKVCGQLPIGLYAPCCAVLPSGELMVAGG